MTDETNRLAALASAPACAASPDHADIMETIANAGDDWQKQGYPTALAEVRDMANVGRALVERIADHSSEGPLKGWHPADCPTEIVCDLLNMLADASAPADPLPDIGPDPFKDPREDDRYEGSRLRLRAAYVQQQKGVPDQTALVWRYDLGTVLEMAIRLKSILADDEEAASAPAGDVVEEAARRMYEDRPYKIDTVHQAQSTGLPMGAAVTWDDLTKAGYDLSEWYRLARAALARPHSAVAPAGDGVALKAIRDIAFDAMRRSRDPESGLFGDIVRHLEAVMRAPALARPRAAVDQCGKCRGSGHVQRADSGECDACGGSGYHGPDEDSPRAAVGEQSREDICAIIEGMTREEWDGFVARAGKGFAKRIAILRDQADRILAVKP